MVWDKTFSSLLFLILLLLSLPPVIAAERRTALVIGNAAYEHAIGPLRNPVNDAGDMAGVLRQLGFHVTLLLDADRRTMLEAIETFSRHLRQGGVGLFYFAGHGVQVNGENYLLPLRTTLSREQDVPYEAVPVGRVLGGMEDADNQLNIIILDACRNNPFTRQWRSSQRGLAVVEAVRGSLVAYATAPGAVALDGRGRNGLYTSQLLQHLPTPGLSVEHLFKRVRSAVVKVTDGKQIPWESSSLIGDFFFVPQTAEPPPAPLSPAPTTADPDAVMWAVVQDSPHPEDIEAYLKAYPQGRYAPAARLKLRRLQRQPEPSTPGTQVAVGVYPPASPLETGVPNPPTPPITYVGRIIDSKTNASIRGVKVSFEFQDAPLIVYTDSEGIYRFIVNFADQELHGRVRVEAPGYPIYDRFIRLTPGKTRLEDIRLNPILPTPSDSEPSPSNEQSPWPTSEKEELIKNGKFEDFYRPAWNAQINGRSASIEQPGSFASILFNGEGTDSKAVEFYQVANVSDPTDLIFNLRIKISDFESEGFPIGALTFMDHLNEKVFQIIFTPDKHYKPEANDYLYQIRNGLLEDITISPLEYARKRLPLETYKKATKAKISFYIAVPSGYRCRRCAIEVHHVSLMGR